MLSGRMRTDFSKLVSALDLQMHGLPGDFFENCNDFASRVILYKIRCQLGKNGGMVRCINVLAGAIVGT